MMDYMEEGTIEGKSSNSDTKGYYSHIFNAGIGEHSLIIRLTNYKDGTHQH